MSLHSEFLERLSAVPVVAILRGVRPDEVVAIADAIVAAGVTLIEVPLNSPDPFTSVALLARRFAGHAIVGAGTVLAVADVARCQAAGAQLIVSPNLRTDVVAASVAAGMIAAPGCLTPTEVFAALDAGAHAIKLFPGELVSPAVVRAMRAVLPSAATLLVVGGVTTDNAPAFQAAGADGFGVGGALYRPGMTAAQEGQNATAFVTALATDSGALV